MKWSNENTEQPVYRFDATSLCYDKLVRCKVNDYVPFTTLTAMRTEGLCFDCKNSSLTHDHRINIPKSNQDIMKNSAFLQNEQIEFFANKPLSILSEGALRPTSLGEVKLVFWIVAWS